MDINFEIREYIPKATPRGKKSNRRTWSVYRENKVGPHVTSGGVGLVGQLMDRQRKHKRSKR